MLLAVDIGNTDIVFGLHDGRQWQYQWRVPVSKYTETPIRMQHYASENGLNLSAIDQLIISSVVPAVTPGIKNMMIRKLKPAPIIVGPATYPQLPIVVPNPEEIGTDLVANSVAAFDRFQQTTIIVDFGTALTFTVVDDATIQGVAIAPGLKTAMRALIQNTAQLPEVPLVMPESAIGKGTQHALQAGILMGYVGLVNHLLDQIQSELGQDCPVVATGGLSSILTPLHNRFDAVDPLLTLEGLRLIAKYNQQ